MDSMHVLDECSQASGDITNNMMAEGGVQQNLPEREHSHMSEEPRRETQRVPTLKREKSQTHTLERKKKRVKFCSDDGEVVVATHVFKRQVGESQAAPNAALTTKIKKLLKKRSNKSKCSMETQTDGAESPDAVDTVDSTPRPMSSCSDDSMVMAPSPCSSCCSHPRDGTPVNQVPLDDLIWGIVTPTRRSSMCSSVCTMSQDDELCISSIEDSTQEEDEIYCESCCAAIQEECICDVTKIEFSCSPTPPNDLSDISIPQEPLCTTQEEKQFSTITHLSPYILTQAISPRSITPTQQECPDASTHEMSCIPLQQDSLGFSINHKFVHSSEHQETTFEEETQESISSFKQENLLSIQKEEEIPKSIDENEVLSSQENKETNEELKNCQSEVVVNEEEQYSSISEWEIEVMNTSTMQKRPCTPTEDDSYSQSKQEPPDPPTTPSKRKRTSDSESSSVEITQDFETTNEELNSSQSELVVNVPISEEDQKNIISAKEKEVSVFSTIQNRPCTPTKDNSCSQLKQESPDLPVTPSKRKRTSDCESPSVDITPECEITKSPILRAPNVTPTCVTEHNAIKPVATFSPGSARAKAAALLARARAVKAEETSKVISESVNVQQLNITTDIDNSLVNNENKLETQEIKAETQQNGSGIQDYNVIDKKDHVNSKDIQDEMATFIENNKKCTENIEKNEKNAQKNLEFSLSKQIDPYQIKEKLESLEKECDTQLNETSKPNYEEQVNINEDHIQEKNLAIEDSEIEINVISTQERSVERNENLIDCHEQCQSENNLEDKQLPEEHILINKETTSVKKIIEMPEVTIKREGTFTADDKIVEESAVTIKREGTFTLDSPTDDGPSPPKIVKPSSKEELNSKDLSDISATGAVPKRVKFSPIPKIEAPKSPRKTRLGNTKNVKEKLKKIEGKLSPFSTTTTVPDKIKPAETPKISPRPNPRPIKSVKPSESPVVILRNSARKTIMNAWRKTTGMQEETNKSNTESNRTSMQRQQSPTKSPKTQKKALVLNTKISTPKEMIPKIKVLDKSPIRFVNKREKPMSSLSGVFKRDPMPKWENKNGTRNNKKFDSEKEKLQAEVNRLSADRERLQSELTDARIRVEEEVVARRALRRTHDGSMRQLREGETRRTELIVADLRNRLEDEKRESLNMLKEALTKGHEADLVRVDRERDEEQRKIRSQAKIKEERLKAELRSQTYSKHEAVPPVQCCHHDREIDRLNREILSLKENRKKLEVQVETLSDNERKHASELRRIHEEHETVLSKLNKTNKSEAIKLLDELRSKEKIIEKLGLTVTAQSSKIRLLEEKTRAASSAGSVGRKHKDGRASREKDGCGSGASSRCSRSVESDISSLSSSGCEEQSTALAAAMAAEVEALRMQVEQQRQEMEQQRLEIKERRQEMERERQELQATLQLEARERECATSTPRPTWPLRRESCVKVCELPTVPEQVSDEEVTPLSTPENSPTQSRPSLAPFNQDPFGACDEYSNSPDTATTFLSPITPGTEPLWPQVWGSNISSQYAQLSREHQELQKSYQLLASTTSTVPSTPELLESIGGKDGPSEWWAAARALELETEAAALRSELQEAQDQRDLLEFRILELTEGIDKQSEASLESPLMCDQSTLTEYCDITVDTGSNISTSTNEDLSLPLSIDSGLDLSNDYKARVVEGRNWLNTLTRSVTEESEKAAAAHLTALLDWLANHNHHALPMSPTLHTPSPMPKTMGVGEEHGELGRDLMILAARLQEALADPQTQEPLLIDTIAKLRLLDTSLSGLQERVVHLSDENRELHDALQALSDAHETRTEASGTESELIHRKTPSLHSDLSDSESDSPDHTEHSRSKMAILEHATSFQESGIFDTSCEVVSSSTQTDEFQLLDGISKETLLHENTGVKNEVNLQTAVARLAVIKSAVEDRDLRNMRISDLQESDEYLKTSLENEHITLNKYEYDSIVENERRLQQEVEHLKCDKDQLTHDFETLKSQFRIHRDSQSSEAEQDLRGQMRVMSQQLECSERYRVEVFEEKCELEEAENDARLMVQRLESQIDAAHEMENLLSASLSQEQEISREFQRRVRDLQVLEKGHRSRIAALESMNQEAQDRAATLAYARDALATQLTFAAYGLVLVDAWRHLVGCPSSALIPYNGSPFTVSPGPYPTKGLDAEIVTLSESSHNLLSKDVPMCVPNMCDVIVQTVPNTAVHMAVQANVDSKCVGVQYQQEEIIDEGFMDHGQRRPAEDIYNEDEPATKKARSANTKSQATMTVSCSEVSDREAFYLEQIESLQKEKMNLRKNQEGERRDSLQQHDSLETEAEDLRTQLREAEKTKCQLLFQVEEIEDQRDRMQADLRRRIEELKGDMSRYSDLHELEKKALRRDYEARISEVVEERRRYEDRIRDLELQLSTLRQELEIVGVSIANDLVEFDSDMGNMLNQNHGKSSRSSHCETDGDLLTKIRELVKSETSFRQKITELEKKEYAYRETIREADKIMSSHVTTYKQRIEDLEGTIEQKNAKIQQLESSEERLRTSLRTTSRSSEGTRISDLLDRLIETENSELKLKENVWSLEKSEKELQIKLMEAEKTQQSLRGELRDQEEMVQRLMTLETENNSLSIELTQAQDAAHKLSDVQQNESYLRGRVEELEVTENMLRETLRQADLIMAQRERKLRDQVLSLEEEIGSYKTQLESAVFNQSQSKECEGHLRKQLEELRNRLADTERDLKESSSETISHESQHRTEVTKMRNQLKLANSQLNDLDTLNCALRDRVLAAEAEVENLATETEESSRKHEQDLLSLNLQVSDKESRIKELESQLEQMSHSNAVNELDTLSGTAITALHDSINNVATTLKNCPACSVAEGATLTEVTSQLSTLTEVLEGRTDSSDSEPPTDTEEEEPHIEISAENLVVEATTTSPPTPAGEGHMEHTSGDVLGRKRSRKASRRRTRRLLEDSTSILPYPGGSSTILEELEEKVRELEDAVSNKEEELRLADNEAHDLHSQLQHRDNALANKSDELEQLNVTLATLRQQILCTMEDYERDKLSLEAKHKIDIEELTSKVEQLTKDVERITSRGRDKDYIIVTLSNQIRAILRSGNMSVVINQLRNLKKEDSSNNTELPKDQTLPDFDLDVVCSLLNQPFEMGSLPDPAIYQTGMEPCNHVTCKSSTLSTPSGESTSHMATQGSPSLVQQKKSRIPRYMPPSVPSVKSIIPPNKIKQNYVQSKGKQPVQPWGRAPTRFSYKTLEKQQNGVASSRASPTISDKPTSTLSKSQYSEVEFESQSSSSTVVDSEPPAQINALPEVPINNVPSFPGSGVYGTMKPLATSTPAKTTGRKDSTRRERSTRFVSDARKIKRMVTGIAPLDAAVDCASAPEWQDRLQATPPPPTSSKSRRSYEIEATCVPRPQELHITRRVGVDGVVIAWAPLEHDCVAGFQVLVGGRVVQHVRSPHRTKALVTGLPLAGTFTIGLVTIANDGRCSTPVLVTQDRTRIYAAKRPPKTLRRMVPTAL